MSTLTIAIVLSAIAQAIFVFEAWRGLRRIRRTERQCREQLEDIERTAAKLQADALDLAARQVAFQAMCDMAGVEIVRVDNEETKH